MDENKPQEPTYSRESMQTTGFAAPPEAPKAPQPPGLEPAAPSFRRILEAQLSAFLDSARELRQWSLADLTAYLKRSRHVWLTTAGVILGMIAFVTLIENVYAWARDARERRHERAVATVTPERLIARCGAASEDVTKEVFPILMRTMSYPARGDQKLVVSFSRTAEEQSDWVFLSMNNESGSAVYDTPDAKIDALPCLNSTK
jgi:hypothetical protein